MRPQHHPIPSQEKKNFPPSPQTLPRPRRARHLSRLVHIHPHAVLPVIRRDRRPVPDDRDLHIGVERADDLGACLPGDPGTRREGARRAGLGWRCVRGEGEGEEEEAREEEGFH
eukprot:CAMPEP_0174885398 /NCGR_PEP_ID=MMETSP0167-20121228/654_1 /TAXON_ID=38298 /ORGANISM="Rhodella maculata, Strain CCMP736" /LENGTH=113 /DNA_ID=CAMNT_0016120945 /DNA_START=617 /DNA_END=958 /DNA_ORIENTATION=-